MADREKVFRNLEVMVLRFLYLVSDGSSEKRVRIADL